METFWVLTYIVIAYHHLGADITMRYEPRAQWMPSEEICEATKDELIRITHEGILFSVDCQELIAS